MNPSLIRAVASGLGAIIGMTLVTLTLGAESAIQWKIAGAVIGALAFSAPFRGNKPR